MEIIINGKRLLNSNIYEKIVLTITPVDLSVDVTGDMGIEQELEKTSTLPITETMRTDNVKNASYDLADYYQRFGKVTSISMHDGNVIFKNNIQSFVIPYSIDTIGGINLLINKFNDDRLNFLDKYKDLDLKIVYTDESSYQIIEENGKKYILLNIYQNGITLMHDGYFISNLFDEMLNTSEEVEHIAIRPIDENIYNIAIGNRIISYSSDMKRYVHKSYMKRLERIMENEEKQYKLNI